MCGICGWVSRTGSIDKTALDSMCDILRHRGPDDRGVYVDGDMGIAMRRLSIIDLSSGRQPIHNEDESMWIVFNGEIYNYKELRHELEESGHIFYTNSDTETILHLYEQYREKALDRLRGMFTFAILDKNERRLFIGRDRLGIKPLYYFWDGKEFIFASEIKSILSAPGFRREIQMEAVEQYFTFGYVPGELTLFKGIYKLQPGHYMVLERQNLTVWPYWSLPSRFSANGPPLDESIDEFYRIFSDCVKRHLLSDVPVGAFLSGGVDSSVVVGVMSKISDLPVETFSIGYDKEAQVFDERVYSRVVAKKFGTRHREFVIEPDVVDILPKIISFYDEPIGDASVIPNYYLSERVSEHVTVALSGLGGDELCAGYERYLGALVADYVEDFPPVLLNLLKSIARRIPDSRSGRHFPGRVKRFLGSARLPLKDRYYNFIAKFNDEEREKLFTERTKSCIKRNPGYDLYCDHWDNTIEGDGLRKLLKLDMETYLVDDLLSLTDKVSMAHSLEVRVPFLDHKIVEFFWNLPSRFKINRLTKKYFLKTAAERILPRDIIYRKKKGFSVPLTLWFRGPLKKYTQDALIEHPNPVHEIFDKRYIKTILDEHFSAKANHDEKIFLLLAFSIWHGIYFENHNCFDFTKT